MFFRFFILFERITFFRIPAFETVILGRGREAKLLFEDRLPFRTEQKIDEQQARVRAIGADR